jgi:hypothetical protein
MQRLPISMRLQTSAESATKQLSAAAEISSFAFVAADATLQSQESWRQQGVLSLDDWSNVIFRPEDTLLIGDETFSVIGSTLQVKKEGLYLVELSYKHTSDAVEVVARLPCSPGASIVVLKGKESSFRRRCNVLLGASPQNLTVGVSWRASDDDDGSGEDGGATAPARIGTGEFKLFQAQMWRPMRHGPATLVLMSSRALLL